MKAIIMAGGEGTRLKSVSGDLPKPMVLLAGKPVLEHILSLLKRCGIKEVCMSLHYRPEIIQNYFGSGEKFGIPIKYHIESVPLGTAGGVKACKWFYGDRDFMVISGDSACDFDLKALTEAHRRHRPAVTMALYSHPSPLRYGTVLFDRMGRVVSFTEKPSWGQVVSDMINTGIYVLSPEAMEPVPENTMFDFSKDLFPILMKSGKEIRALPMDGYWCDIGTPRSYFQCNLDAIDGRLHLDAPALGPDVPEQTQTAKGLPLSGREIFCRSRARAMRLISQSLMEAGADFSDGITLDTAEGRVKIAPSSENESIIINASAENREKSAALAAKFENFIKSNGSFA